MNASRIILIGMGFLCGTFAQARAGMVVVDHPRHPYGGLGSDTLFTGPFGQQVWQRVADDFVLSSPATISSLVAFGFYNEDNPPPTETMRVRFLGARPGGGLPDEGNVLSETTVQNPSRITTGNIVFVDDGPYEYRFEMNLAGPLSLAAGQRYWVEFVQIGDLATHFRWESSTADLNGRAFINSITNEWRTTLPGGTADTAYQLIAVPEPSAVAMLGSMLLIFRDRRNKARLRGS